MLAEPSIALLSRIGRPAEADTLRILAQLRTHEAEFRALGIVRLSLFGSVARNEQRPASDIDLLATSDDPIHIGRRSRRRRETVLEVMEYRNAGPEFVVMSVFSHSADWLRNIEAAPHPEVVIGGERFIAAHRLLDAEEAIGVVEGYERRNWFMAPLSSAWC